MYITEQADNSGEASALVLELLRLGVEVHVFTADDVVVTQPAEMSQRNKKKLIGKFLRINDIILFFKH